MPTFLRTHNKKLDEWYDMEWMDTFFFASYVPIVITV